MMKSSFDKVQAAIRKGVFSGMRLAGHRPGKAIRNLHYGREPCQALDIYLPADGFRGTQMVFLHGGSWQSGHKDEYAYLGAALAAFGISCAVVGYRLFPQVRYPQFVEDVAHAVSWLRRDGLRYGFSDAPVYLMGHSAGAHIACMMAMDERYREIAGLEADSVAGVIGLSGVYRFRPETSQVYRDIFSCAQDDFEAVKPINYVGKDKVPLLMLHGEADDVIGIRNAQQMLEAARQAGQRAILHSQPGYGHARPIFDFLPFMPNHQKMMALILSFVSQKTVHHIEQFQ
jgi:acetyl esterase/lipase